MIRPTSTPRSIVTISSSSATIAYPPTAGYCLSKTGLSMLTQLFALRLADDGIGVYEIRPGLIRTSMTAAAAGPYDEFIARGGVPERRWVTPEDVGRAVATIASGGFSYVTGEAIAVGGGLQIATGPTEEVMADLFIEEEQPARPTGTAAEKLGGDGSMKSLCVLVPSGRVMRLTKTRRGCRSPCGVRRPSRERHRDVG